MAEQSYDEDITRRPHDGLVKRVFTKPEVAAVELQQVLPAALVSHLDWSTLQAKPGSFVSPKLRERATDILYSIGLRGSKQEVLIFVLMEHQSTLCRVMAVRFFIYVARIWESYLSSQPQTLESIPFIVPVLLYHGPKGWTMPRRLSELFDIPPQLAELFPSPIELVFDVDDLHESVARDRSVCDQHSDHAIVLAEAARTLLWLACHPDEVNGPRAERLGPILDLVSEAWGLDELQALLTYVLSAFETESSLEGILLESASKGTIQVYATIKDELIAAGETRGMTKGMARGETKGMVKMLERLLDRRGLALGPKQHARITECEDEKLLQRWFDRAVTATTIEAVFDN